MTNHVHQLVTPSEAKAIPRLMISLGRRYVQYNIRTYRRTGTLWDSRDKSSLVEADAYLLPCQRYIELNPVQAAMVADPADYRWSSYRANGLGQHDSLLAPHPIYVELGQADAERQAAYRTLFRSELGHEAIGDIRMGLNQGQPLGGSRLIDSIEIATGQRREVRPRGRPLKPKEDVPLTVSQLTMDVRAWPLFPAPFLRTGRPALQSP